MACRPSVRNAVPPRTPLGNRPPRKPCPHARKTASRDRLLSKYAHLDAIDAQAKEVLAHFYQALLKTPAFTLKDGTKCSVEPFYEPEVNSGGDLQCGFDVRMDNGTQLEFTFGKTGWGKSFVEAEAQKAQPKAPGRRR